MKNKTLGQVITERRVAVGLSLKDLGKLIQKEDGSQGVSYQYVHDIEHDRRAPSEYVLSEIARNLGVDPCYLAAVAGHPLSEVETYLKKFPEAAPAVAALFARATSSNFDKWSSVRT